MCTHVPEEILYAAGIVPVRILSSHDSQAMTRSYIHETYCSFSHDCAYQGLSHTYDFLDLIATSSSCIHMGEAFNVWVRFAGFEGRSFLIPYPHIIETKPAAAFMVRSFEEFKRFLDKFVQKPITDEDIEKAIRVCNHTRRLPKQLWGFLRRENPPVTGPDVATVTLASQLMDKKECNPLLEELIQSVESEPGKGAPGPRLMVSGGACDDLGIFDLIENLDYRASLVFIDSCTARDTSGSRCRRAGPTSFRPLPRDTSAGFRVLQKTMFQGRVRKRGSGSSSSSSRSSRALFLFCPCRRTRGQPMEPFVLHGRAHRQQ